MPSSRILRAIFALVSGVAFAPSSRSRAFPARADGESDAQNSLRRAPRVARTSGVWQRSAVIRFRAGCAICQRAEHRLPQKRRFVSESVFRKYVPPHHSHVRGWRHFAFGFGRGTWRSFFVATIRAVISGCAPRHLAAQEASQKRFRASCEIAGTIVAPQKPHGLGCFHNGIAGS
jgi:hypothetical protein